MNQYVAEELRNSVKTDIDAYKGMDKAALEKQRVKINSIQDMCERAKERAEEDIKNLKQEIKAYNKLIEATQKAFTVISEAENYANNVQYENIIKVCKKTEMKRIGNSPYPYASNFKDVIVYYYEIYEANKLGIDKGKNFVTKSRNYETKNKSLFYEDMLKAMKEYAIFKLYYAKNEGIKINVGLIEKNIKGVKIFEI